MKDSERTSYTLEDLAARFGGEVLGVPSTRVHQVATLEKASAGTITFLANPRYLPQLKRTSASAVLVGTAMKDATALPRIVCEDPYVYFARVSALLNPAREARAGVHSTAVVASSAWVAPDAEVGPHVVVGKEAHIGPGSIVGPGCVIGDRVRIGSRARLHAHVTIYDDCVLGNRVVAHSGVVIGADGFGIAMDGDRWIKIPQIGRVVIGDDVEIGANTTIDRGAIDDTIVEDGVKLDNHIQIAHNVHIGAHTAIAGCVGIAGSTRIGRRCRIGGAAGIAGHITIADGVEISAYTAVTKSIEKPGAYSGLYPFAPNREWRRNAVHLRHLADLADRLRSLEKQFEALGRSKN